MARNVPQGRVESLEWLEVMYPVWSNNHAGIGLTSAQTIDLAQDVINTRSSFTSVVDVRVDSKAKTQTFYSQSDDLSKKAGALLTLIKGFAEASNDPAAVYALAQITGKASPTPAAAPQEPSILNARLNGPGSVTLNFIGNGPVGTAWQVSRQLAGEPTMTIIGNGLSSTKSFTDTAVPAGIATAEYQIQGFRGDLAGPASFSFLVKFGSEQPAQQSQAA